MNSMADESVPSAPESDYSDRVDALLSSALADQAKEKRQLVETLYGAKTALGRAEQEITALKDLIAKRDEELLDAIDDRLAAVFDAIDDRLTATRNSLDLRISDLEDALIKIAKSVSQVPQKVRGDLETAALAIGERLGEESDGLLRSSREDAIEVVASFSKVTDRGVSQIRDAVEGAREEYRTTTEQLAAYLGQRDDSLQRSRDQVLIDLFRQLGESLGKRNAKKVAGAISEDPGFGRAARDSAPKQPRGRSGVRQVPAPPQGPAGHQSVPGNFAGSGFSADRPSRSVPEPFVERFGDSTNLGSPFGGDSSFGEYASPPDQPFGGEPAAPTMANPLIPAERRVRGEPARDYMVPVLPSDSGQPGDENAAANLFGSMASEDASTLKRRRRIKPPEEPPSKGPAKPSRRKP